jgi:hypothetical protein
VNLKDLLAEIERQGFTDDEARAWWTPTLRPAIRRQIVDLMPS